MELNKSKSRLTKYNTLLTELQTMIHNFVVRYNIKASYLMPQTEDDDLKWSLYLGNVFGSVNILLDSYVNEPSIEIDNDVFINFKYDTYRDGNDLLDIDMENTTSFFDKNDGMYVIANANGDYEELKKAFAQVLEIWSMTLDETDNNNTFQGFSLN